MSVNQDPEYMKVARAKYRATEHGRAKEQEYESRPYAKKARRARTSKYITDRCRRDPQFRISRRLRTRLWTALKKMAKTGSAVRDLGCTVQELRTHLETQFKPGMTWENWGHSHGKWQIDHIRPLAGFDLTQREQLLQACHYTNLQPLWFEEHAKKTTNDKRSLS